MNIGLHVKCPLFLSDFHGNSIFSTDFRKSSDIKFHKNPSGENRIVPCGQTDRHEAAHSSFTQFCEDPSLTSEINLERFKGKYIGAD